MASPMHCTTRLFLALPLIITASACASSSQNYPSLEVRDFERNTGTLAAPDPRPQATSPVAPPSPGDLNALEAQAKVAHRAFIAATPAARQSVARAAGAAVTSNAWGDAQIALSDLEAKRSLTAVALGDLDLLYAEQAIALNSGEAVIAARTRVTGLLREEDKILAQLRGQIVQ